MCNKLLSALALAAAIILSSGCAKERIVYVQDPLPIPDWPELPRIKADSMQCLSDDAYEALVKRDALQASHIRLLEAIIMTTHQ